MAAGDGWNAEKMFQLYLHDYMLRKNLHKSAEIFAREANISNAPVVIGGFLSEWWSVFYDIFSSRQVNNKEDGAAYPVKDMLMTEIRPQNLSAAELTMQCQRHPQFSGTMDSKNSLTTAQAYELAMSRKTRDLHLMHPNKMKHASIASSSQQHVQKQIPQPHGIEKNNSSSFGNSAIYGVQKTTLPRSVPYISAANERINPVTLKGWPLIVNGTVGNHVHQIQTPTAREPVHIKPLLAMPQRSATENLQTHAHAYSKVNSLGRGEQIMDKAHQSIPQEELPEAYSLRQRTEEQDQKVFGKVEEEKMVKDDVESLSDDSDTADDINTHMGNLRKSSTDGNMGSPAGSLEEMGCLNSSGSEVLCCSFSSNGKLLASGGHDRKVLIWNIDTLASVSATEDHGNTITDVRFRPSSAIFATSSFDKTVKVWDSCKPSRSLIKFIGHGEQVMSLDFHPRKSDLLCSCDSNGEMRIWNINSCMCVRVTKGAVRQLRFQPLSGKLLAAAAETGVNVIDVETDRLQFSLKGHATEVRSLCWDASGKYIASVSDDSARIWSASSGGMCLHELLSNGGKFESCVFHPGHPLLLVIGGYQALQVWNPAVVSKAVGIQAHDGMITALADSAESKVVASASHDHLVKLWK